MPGASGLVFPAEPKPAPARPAGPRRPGTAIGGGEASDRSEQQPECGVGWRLMGANHRELGHGAAAFGTLGECRAAVARLREGIERTRGLLTMSHTAGTWTWRLELAGQDVAVSGRTYQRQREAQHNLKLFLAAVPLAQDSDTVPARPRLRGLQPPGPAAEGRGRERAERADARVGGVRLVAVGTAGRTVRP